MTPDDPLASLYHDRIRTLAAAVRNDRRLEGADLSLTQVSPLCGSRVTLDIALDAALRIKAFGWRVRACTLGAAATALVVRSAQGLRLHAAAGWHDAMQRRLEGEDGAGGFAPGHIPSHRRRRYWASAMCAQAGCNA